MVIFMINFVLFSVLFSVAVVIAATIINPTIRKKISYKKSISLTTSFIILTLLGWWFVTAGSVIEERILSPIILPNPVEVVQAFPDLHFNQNLVRSAFTSFTRVGVGFLLATLVAITLGTYMASFSCISDFFKPLALVSAYVPIIVFVPLTLAWWGTSETQKIGFLFIACFVALLPLVIKAINNVNSSLVDVALTKGASSRQILRHVLLPVSMPEIWEHLRGVYGVGWGWIILAEVVNAQNGLGYLISVSERRGHTNSTFAVIIVIVLIAILCDKIWVCIGKKLFPYKNR
jgi:NitT/TauT family transport system permease protein